jgi:hypothetical protein
MRLYTSDEGMKEPVCNPVKMQTTETLNFIDLLRGEQRRQGNKVKMGKLVNQNTERKKYNPGQTSTSEVST